MFRLTVVAGPTRGASYTLKDGETGIGRLDDNTIPLHSSKVSKRHCVLVASDGELLVRDEGSSNGTFVNGVLTRTRKMTAGDRLSVGEFVFEVSETAGRKKSRSTSLSLVRTPDQDFSTQGVSADLHSHQLSSLDRPPQDLKGRIFWAIEKYVMPTFYSMNQKTEWRSVGVVLLGTFVLMNLVISIQPVLDTARRAVIKEAQKRAKFVAQQIAERNGPAISAGAESKTDLGSVEFADTVRLVALTDLEGRIIAPAKRAGQYLTSGSEAVVANKARSLFHEGRETGISQEIDDDTVVAVEPVVVLNTAAGKNMVAAMAVVSVDTSVSSLGLGEMGLIYSESLVLTIALGLIIFFLLYRLTIKPLEVLGDDLDKVLKGELSQVTHEFKCEETNPLFDLVNSLAQRVPRGSGEHGVGGSAFAESEYKIEDALPVLKLLGARNGSGLAVCDAHKRVVFLSEGFEEITGIRMDSNLGQELSTVTRDQAFGSLVSDLLERCGSAESASEEFDFSGVAHQVSAASIVGQKGYVLLVKRSET